MVFWSFEQLLIIDITIYGAALFLEFLSLIVLRIKAPNEHRPFKIPLNIVGLCGMVLLPLIIYGIAITAAFTESAHSLKPLLFAIGILFTGEIVWRIIVWRTPKMEKLST
jgi:amino acid transporter